jgi:hypothetical protein
MSSPAVRAAIRDQLAQHWTATPWFDLSDYQSLDDLPADSASSILLVQFAFAVERIETIAAPELHSWNETGTIYFHLLAPVGDPSGPTLALGEQLRPLFKGKRFGRTVVEACDPFTDMEGAAIKLDGKWHGWSSAVSYYQIICGD